ncbi:monooxygenase, partial [Streptomyces sp. NPDC007070]
ERGARPRRAGCGRDRSSGTSPHAVLLDLTGSLPAGLPLPPRIDLVHATCRDDLGAAVLLIRPDGYVRWAADRLADGDEDALLAAVAEGLARTP